MRKYSFAVLLTCLSAIALAVPTAHATTCNVSHGNCDAYVSLVEFTGSPTVPCVIGYTVLTVRVTVTCGAQKAVSETKLCGAQVNAYTFEALGYQHTLKPVDGSRWEDIFDGDCSKLDYKRQPL